MLTLVLLFLACTQALPTKRWWTEPVDLGYALIQGFKQGGLNQYLGIRYATAERFQAPHVPLTNRTLYTALENPTQCYQNQIATMGSNQYDYGPQTEDCLMLNVYAPDYAEPGSNYPVLFYIHGGGYEIGSVAENNFSAFTQQSVNAGQPIVVVTIQYRLGAFGFLAGQETYDNGVLNAGLLDQEYALQWVQRHIYYFGGDKSHVTIWGESAGAGSVMSQVLARGGNQVKALGIDAPLFSAAILSSNFAPTQYDYNAPIIEERYKSILNLTGCADFACLSSLDAEAFSNATDVLSYQAEYGIWVYVPVVDGTFLTGLYSEMIAAKKFNTPNILSLNNYNEGLIFTNPNLLNDNADQSDGDLDAAFDAYIQKVLPNLTASQRQSVIQEYPASDFPRANNTFSRADAINSMPIFVCPGYNMAMSAVNGWYGYYVAGDAVHAADLALYSGKQLSGSQSLLQSFDGAMLSMIFHYNPNHNPLTDVNPQWPTVNSGQLLQFNSTDGLVTGQADPTLKSVNMPVATDFTKGLADQCSFWLGPIALAVPN